MNLIYVDDEMPALLRFNATIALMEDVKAFNSFFSPAQALAYAKTHPIDVAFLDVEMPQMSGIELAAQLKLLNENIKIVFVTAYPNYALEAFSVDAIGYLLKPYSRDMVRRMLDKAKLILPKPSRKVFIRTMPSFEVYVDGALLPINSAKPKELLAVLVDRNGGAVTAGLAISCLWEDKEADQSTRSLYRMTLKRLRQILDDARIGFILGSDGQQRYIKPDMFDCDLYRLYAGDKAALRAYTGVYMSQYSWAEETNARLMKLTHYMEE